MTPGRQGLHRGFTGCTFVGFMMFVRRGLGFWVQGLKGSKGIQPERTRSRVHRLRLRV